MKKALKISLIVVVIFIALFAALLFAAEKVLNSTSIKSQIEKMLGEELDMNFMLKGPITVDFFPVLSLATDNISVEIPSGQISSADRIEIKPHLLDLLRLNVHLQNVAIERPQIFFDQLGVAKIMAWVEAKTSEYKPIESFAIDAFTILDARFHYADEETLVDLKDINVSGGSLIFISDRKTALDDVVSFLKGIHFTGTFTAPEISSSSFKLENIKAKVKDEEGILTFDPIELEYLGSAAKLRATLDLSKNKPFLQSQLSLSGLNIEVLLQEFYPDIDIKGGVNVTADVTATGIQINNLIERLRAITQADRPVEEDVFPVNEIMIRSIMVSASKLKFTKDTTKVDNAKVELTCNRLSVIKKNRVTIKDLKTLLRNARFDAKTQINNLSVGNEQFSNIKSAIRGDQGILKSDSIELNYFGARTKIAGVFNMQDNLNYLKVRIEMPEVDLEKSFVGSGDPDIAKGVIDIKAEFEARAAFIDEILKNAYGDFSIKGRNLILKGVDLDKALDEFKKISGYGFNDFSALILLGPLGTVVSHGYDQLEAVEKIMAATGNSTIKQVVSDWNVVAGVVTAKDVAFSTQRNRVAVKGSLDITNQKFNSMTIAVVDPDGCILNSETVNGSFENPEVKNVGVIERTVVRPLKRLFKTKCDFFYDGSLPHPTEGQPSGGHN